MHSELHPANARNLNPKAAKSEPFIISEKPWVLNAIVIIDGFIRFFNMV